MLGELNVSMQEEGSMITMEERRLKLAALGIFMDYNHKEATVVKSRRKSCKRWTFRQGRFELKWDDYSEINEETHY